MEAYRYGQRSGQKPNNVLTYLKMNGGIRFDLRLQSPRDGLQRRAATGFAETGVEISVLLPQ